MTSTIETSAFGTVITITFKNNGRGGVIETWVCATKAAYKTAIADLRAMPHIEILSEGDSHVAF